jgi:hypothetical protein
MSHTAFGDAVGGLNGCSTEHMHRKNSTPSLFIGPTRSWKPSSAALPIAVAAASLAQPSIAVAAITVDTKPAAMGGARRGLYSSHFYACRGVPYQSTHYYGPFPLRSQGTDFASVVPGIFSFSRSS